MALEAQEVQEALEAQVVQEAPGLLVVHRDVRLSFNSRIQQDPGFLRTKK